VRVGVIMELSGRPGPDGRSAPSWEELKARAVSAESAGFDTLVYEDALMYRGPTDNVGVWEAVAISGAIAEATSRIEFGPSVFNGVYRNPAMLANVAMTLDEVSGGRFLLGLGAGNTPDDYEAFGFPTDHRFTRFAEAVDIIHRMIHGEAAYLEGRFWRAAGSETVLRGPRRPPIIIAAGGPRMMRLTANYADEWNWWVTLSDSHDDLAAHVRQFDNECEQANTDPASIRRSLDLYGMEQGIGPNELAESILAFGALGFGEVRCALRDWTIGSDLVSAVRRG